MSVVLICAGLPWASAAAASEDFLSLPLEDLLKIELSSASRKMQQVQDVAASVFVISREEIERSGARTIPEALRLAPGVEVARIANNRWAVSIRGFNGRFANKLLVLKDGRSVYSPLFSGVLWEAEDAILGDIERIEVIRGPGAAMWGSNAVNGVINIISRRAADTQGSEVIASTASDEPGSLTLRHGIALGDGHLRISAKGFQLNPARTASDIKGNDDWTAGRLGLRGDWPAADGGSWTLVGETYRSRADDRLDLTSFGGTPPLLDIKQLNTGSNLSLHREQPMADGGQVEWQVSGETSILYAETLVREERTSFAGDFQRRLPLGAHDLIVGASYRQSRDSIRMLGVLSLEHPQRDWRIASLFVNDEYMLIPDQLRLSGGVRVDHDNWSGTQVQPNVRLAWTPNRDTTWWTSLARAARTPSRAELDITYQIRQIPGTPPTQIRRVPTAEGTLKAEKVTTFELGYRQRMSTQLSLDVAAFVSDYSQILSLVSQPYQPQFVPPSPFPVLVVAPYMDANNSSARTHGFEIAADWQVSPDWRIQPNYSRLYMRSPQLADALAAAMQQQLLGRVPRHRASLRSSWNLDNGQKLDLWLKYTSRLANPEVAGYTTLDLRYAFPLGKQAEIAIVGQNLLDKRHPEFVSDYLPIQQSEIGRSLMVKGTWRF